MEEGERKEGGRKKGERKEIISRERRLFPEKGDYFQRKEIISKKGDNFKKKEIISGCSPLHLVHQRASHGLHAVRLSHLYVTQNNYQD